MYVCWKNMYVVSPTLHQLRRCGVIFYALLSVLCRVNIDCVWKENNTIINVHNSWMGSSLHKIVNTVYIHTYILRLAAYSLRSISRPRAQFYPNTVSQNGFCTKISLLAAFSLSKPFPFNSLAFEQVFFDLCEKDFAYQH